MTLQLLDDYDYYDDDPLPLPRPLPHCRTTTLPLPRPPPPPRTRPRPCPRPLPLPLLQQQLQAQPQRQRQDHNLRNDGENYSTILIDLLILGYFVANAIAWVEFHCSAACTILYRRPARTKTRSSQSKLENTAVVDIP